MKEVSQHKIGPIFYGCQFNLATNLVYFVQEKLEYSLGDHPVNSFFHNLSAERRIIFYKQLFKQIFALNKLGFIHNDIKLANTMMDEEKEAVYLIDYGLARQSYKRVECIGSDYHMSPGKCLSFQRSAEILDDLYTLVLMMAELESWDAFADIYKDKTTGRIRKDCERETGFGCLKAVSSNVINIFKKNEFPDPVGGTIPRRIKTLILWVWSN